MKSRKIKKRSRPPISEHQKELLAELKNGSPIYINLYGHRWLVEPMSASDTTIADKMLAYVPYKSRVVLGIVSSNFKNGKAICLYPEERWIPIYAKRLVFLGDIVKCYKNEKPN